MTIDNLIKRKSVLKTAEATYHTSIAAVFVKQTSAYHIAYKRLKIENTLPYRTKHTSQHNTSH